MGMYEDLIQKIASDTMNWRGRVPGFGAAPAVEAAAPAAPVVASNMQVGPVSPQARGYQWGLRQAGHLKSVAGTYGAPLALTTMGLGMADKAIEGVDTATPDNRVERGLNILSGADVTGFGGWLGRKLTGRADTVDNPMLGPAGREFVDSGRTAAPVSVVSPAVTPDDAFSPGGYQGGQGGYTVPAAPVAPVGFGANNRPYQPVTRTVGPDGTINITGSGAPVGYGAQPEARRSGLPGFVGALLNMKQTVGDNAVRAALAKQRGEDIKIGSLVGLQGAQSAEAKAKSAKEAMSAQISAAMLDPGLTDAQRARYQAAASSIFGRTGPAPHYSVPLSFQGNPVKDVVPMVNQGTGVITGTRMTQAATEDILKQTLATNPELGNSRAKGIAALKATGRYTVDTLKP